MASTLQVLAISACVSPLDAAGMAIEQQAVEPHHPVNPLVIGRL